MKKIALLTFFTVLLGVQFIFAQKQISGKVTSAVDGSAMPGVTVSVKGTTTATYSDVNGKYTLSVPATATTLVFTFIGMKTQEVAIGNLASIDVKLESNATNLEGVVVTALGINREKKSLGYSTQEVKGDMVDAVSTDNVTNALSGKVAGVQITTTTNMGGSTNIVMRGNKSLTGNNQALFVVDGVPVDNSNSNTAAQAQGGAGGYDYGNSASDINPDDIESVNVLKGAAATALYGSRAANGVIMITTKKGAKSKKKGIGIAINSSVKVGFLDKSTMPDYQTDYGAGYGAFYGPNSTENFNTILSSSFPNKTGTPYNELWAPIQQDASFGAHFNPNLMVYQWDAVDPQSPYYQQARPWVAAKNLPYTFFNTPVTTDNNVSLGNESDQGSYRLSYTNYDQNGLMPNSDLIKNNLLFNGTWKVNDQLTAGGSANYTTESAQGRNMTGYENNIMTSFREWYEVNVDMKEQESMYNLTKRNICWNYADQTNPSAGPAYWNNPYFQAFQDYESDSRNRFIGNMNLDYKITNWFDIFGRISGDSYSGLQEERLAVGSVGAPFGVGSGPDGSLDQTSASSGYLRRNISHSEYNYDLMGNFNKDISKDISFKGVLGTNIRKDEDGFIVASTNGGLVIPDLYALQNSVDPLALPKEQAAIVKVDGMYASASLGYKNFLYLDLTGRRDESSTLPANDNAYFYPSISGSFVFTNVMPESNWLSFGKVRLNYAEVGNSAIFNQLYNEYDINGTFGSGMTSVDPTFKDSTLKPEITHSWEGGLEMDFFKRRIGFDASLYQTSTMNQIMPLAVSTATGYDYKVINAGEIQNKGVELSINATPVIAKNFKWDVTVNWALNRNEVVSLLPGVTNMVLQSYQGGVTIDAQVGKPYGVIEGTDYTYYNGQHVIYGEGNAAGGQPGLPVQTSTSNNDIGNQTPKWTGGITNTFTYKNWSFSFLIDIQDGGDIFSLDMYYGMADGTYKETDFINDLGNNVRDPVVGTPGNYAPSSGGYIEKGVILTTNAQGQTVATPNNIRTEGSDTQGFGYLTEPESAFVYKATYIKLREVELSYSLPSDLLKKCFITGAKFSLVAANPWIIFKDLPHADPESGLGSGNQQGYSVGSLPSTRDFGFNIKLSF